MQEEKRSRVAKAVEVACCAPSICLCATEEQHRWAHHVEHRPCIIEAVEAARRSHAGHRGAGPLWLELSTWGSHNKRG
jgi:hypothetical protein